MTRPDFLNQKHENGRAIVDGFRLLDAEAAAAVDRWLLWASCYGSMTWQEQCLLAWINDQA